MKVSFGESTYKHTSELLVKAKVQHKKCFEGDDHEQSWQSFKSKNLGKLIERIIFDKIRCIGLDVVSGISLNKTSGENLDRQLGAVKRNLLIDYGEFGFRLPDKVRLAQK